MIAPIPAASRGDTDHAVSCHLLSKLRPRVGPDTAPGPAQETFARFLRSGAPGRALSSAAHLPRIARSVPIDRARRRRQGIPIFLRLDGEREASARPEQTWRNEADLLRPLRQAVLAMPPKARRVFLMRPMLCKKVAARLDFGLATVNHLMLQALARRRAGGAAKC